MKKLKLISYLSISMLLLVSCNQQRGTRTDTPTSGIGKIVADECLAPLIQQEVDVFEALNPEASIFPLYTSEQEAFRLFMADSVGLIVATRELTLPEKQIIKDRQQKLRTQKIAVDAIALIVHKSNKDTLISTADLKRIMTGEVRTWKELNSNSTLGDIEIGFDSPNSSTVRYIKESICNSQELGSNVKARSEAGNTIDIQAATANQKVIDFVAATPNAIGIIGVNWISNQADSTNLSFIQKVSVMSVSSEATATVRNSYKPFAYYLKIDKYPLKRDVFLMISDPRGGLPSGFATFVGGDKGQWIILKSGLLPGISPTRDIRVNANK